MAINREELQLVISILEENAEDLEKIADGLEDVDEGAKKTSKGMELLGGAFKVAQGAAIAAGVAFVKSVPALLNQGNAIESAERALIGYTGSADAAEEATQAVVAAAGGAITEFEATQNASRLFSMGLASTSEEAAKLTEMAITLGGAMGTDATTAFEDFSLMLANQSIPRLDTFGISGAAVRERMAELTQEIDGLDRQTAFMMATMEIGEQALIDLGNAGFQATNNVDRLRAEAGNLKDTLATTIADGLMPWVDGLFAVKDATADAKQEVIDSSVSYEDYLARLDELKEAHPVLTLGTETLTEAQWLQQQATEDLATWTDLLQQKGTAAWLAQQTYANGLNDTLIPALEDANTATEGLDQSQNDLVISMRAVTTAALGREALDALTEAYNNGEISLEAYRDATKEVGVNMLGLTGAEANASIALAELSKSLADGEITVWEFYAAIRAINNEIQGIPSSKTFTLIMKTKGSLPGGVGGAGGVDAPIAFQHGGQFTVSGNAGIDKVPVAFMATAGETVTVSPPGAGKGGGAGVVIDARGAQFFGTGGVQEFADALFPYLQNAERNR